MKPDIPNYKAFPLRLPFLTVLFLFICSLMASLEYLLRTLPHQHDRNSIPQDSRYIPFQRNENHKRTLGDNTPFPSDQLASVLPTKRQQSYYGLVPSTTTTTKTKTTTNPPKPHTTTTPTPPIATPFHFPFARPHARAIKAVIRAPVPVPDPRLPSDQYANLAPITTYITRADRWYGDPLDPFLRTPLFPGDSGSNKCVYNHLGIALTSDEAPGGCLAILGLDPTGPAPVGFNRADWLKDDIAFPAGSPCEDPLVWYPLVDAASFGLAMDLYGRMLTCTWDDGHGSTQAQTEPPANFLIPSGTIGDYFATAGPAALVNPGGLQAVHVYVGDARELIQGVVWVEQLYVERVAVDFHAIRGLETYVGTPASDVIRTAPPSHDTNTTTATSTTAQGGVSDTPIQSPASSATTTSTSSTALSASTTPESTTTTITNMNAVQEPSETSTQDPATAITTPRPTATTTATISAQVASNVSSQDLVSPTTTSTSAGATTSTTLRPSSTTTATIRTAAKEASNISTKVLTSPTTTLRSAASSSSTTSGHSDTTTAATTSTTAHGTSNTSTQGLASSPTEPGLHETPITVSYVWMIGAIQVETTTQFTTDGTLTTSTITSKVSTSMLAGIPAVMVPASLTTLTDADGSPTATVLTVSGAVPVLNPTVVTLTDSDGVPTATFSTDVPVTSRIRTLTDSLGVPTATVTEIPVIPYIPNSKPADDLLFAYTSSYFAIYFFPILLTALLLVPIQILDAEIKLLLPYRLLTRPQPGQPGQAQLAQVGIDAIEVLYLRTGGLRGRLAGWRLLFRYGDVLSVLSDLIFLCAAGLVAVSGETVGLQLRGSCLRQDVSSCLMTVAAFPRPARAAQALLGIMMVLIVVLAWLLVRWKSGMAAHPASIASVCVLLQVPGTANALKKAVDPSGAERLKGTTIRLGWTDSGPPGETYGLLITRLGPALGRQARTWELEDAGPVRTDTQRLKLHAPKTERVTQGAFLFFLCSLLTIVLYYENTVYDSPSLSPFESFMDSQSFGVMMLFTVLGEVVTLSWDYLFNGRFLPLPRPGLLSWVRYCADSWP